MSHDSIVQIHCGVWADVNGVVSGGKGNVLFEETVSRYSEQCGRSDPELMNMPLSGGALIIYMSFF